MFSVADIFAEELYLRTDRSACKNDLNIHYD